MTWIHESELEVSQKLGEGSQQELFSSYRILQGERRTDLKENLIQLHEGNVLP